MFTLLTTLSVMLIVMLISSRLTRRYHDPTAHGYFMAGGKLSYGYIAGSMMLTNISIDQLIGLNGDSYAHNLSAIAWEATAVIAMVALALFFLPRYMQGGFTTLPEFIASRYDTATRRCISILLILTYTLVLNPASLYLGAITLNQIFDIQMLLGLTYPATISLLIAITGVIGAAYAILGGLRAVAISDSINGIFLLFITLLVPVLGFYALGKGSFFAGTEIVLHQSAEKLNMIGGTKDNVPFGTLFTGMLLANLFYWCTNQATIQKSMAAKNLEEGQKGVLLTGFFKLTLPVILMMPGIIAWHLFKDNPVSHSDLAYPQLVAMLLPWWMKGFFVAVILGTVMSHFNAIINASATLLAYDFFKPAVPHATDHQLVKFGKAISIIVALTSIVAAPLLIYAPEGIYTVLRRFTGFFNMPVIAIVLYTLFRPSYASARAAKFVLAFHALIYGVFVLGLKIDERWNISFIHVMGMLFVTEFTLLEIIGRMTPETAHPPKNMALVNITLTEWRHAKSVSILLIALLVSLYLTFSPLGVATLTHNAERYYLFLTSCWIVAITIIGFSEKKCMSKKEQAKNIIHD